MATIPDTLLSKLAAELVSLRRETAGLESLVSAGAAAQGASGVVTAQSLDHILQSLDSLAGLLQAVATGHNLHRALEGVPLAQLAARLAETTPPPQAAVTPGRPCDPELF
jgi:hypothetical protein